MRLIEDSIQINPLDLCIIFGNALDNAIDACAKCKNDEEKIINIHSSLTNGFLFIKIENPIATDVKITNNSITTTKKDKNSHGIGLQSIRTSIQKYYGEMKLSQLNGIFCLEIDLDFHMSC